MSRTSARMRELPGGAVLVGLLLVAVLSCESLSGQTIRGRVLESSSGRPIPSAQVSLLGTSAELVARAETDSLGWFVVRSPEEGTFYLRAERIGYHSVTDGVFDLGDGGEMTVAFYIRAAPIELEGVKVTTEPKDWIEANQREWLESQGFYDRREYGFGHFIPPEDLEGRFIADASDVFRKVPGLAVRPGSDVVAVRRCQRLRGWVDGILVHDGRYDGGAWYIGDLLNAIAAVEVYTRISSLPLQYGGSGGSCVTILIWTK